PDHALEQSLCLFVIALVGIDHREIVVGFGQGWMRIYQLREYLDGLALLAGLRIFDALGEARAYVVAGLARFRVGLLLRRFAGRLLERGLEQFVLQRRGRDDRKIVVVLCLELDAGLGRRG